MLILYTCVLQNDYHHRVRYTSLYLHLCYSFLREKEFFKSPVCLGKNINFDIIHGYTCGALYVRALSLYAINSCTRCTLYLWIVQWSHSNEKHHFWRWKIVLDANWYLFPMNSLSFWFTFSIYTYWHQLEAHIPLSWPRRFVETFWIVLLIANFLSQSTDQSLSFNNYFFI